jgi:hypothetical protein
MMANTPHSKRNESVAGATATRGKAETVRPTRRLPNRDYKANTGGTANDPIWYAKRRRAYLLVISGPNGVGLARLRRLAPYPTVFVRDNRAAVLELPTAGSFVQATLELCLVKLKQIEGSLTDGAKIFVRDPYAASAENVDASLRSSVAQEVNRTEETGERMMLVSVQDQIHTEPARVLELRGRIESHSKSACRILGKL